MMQMAVKNAFVNWLLNFRVSVFMKSAVTQNNLMPLEIKVSALFMMCFMLMEIDSLMYLDKIFSSHKCLSNTNQMSCIKGLKNYLIKFFFSGNISKLRSHVFLIFAWTLCRK